MKASPYLFQLIHSLSKEEKTYLRKQLSVYKKQNVYYRLFEAVLKQKKYDEDALQQLIYPDGNKKKLAVIKNQLHTMILENMVAFHAAGSVGNRLRSLLSTADFLFEKGLYSYCHKKLQEARDIAKAHQKHLYLLEINRLEMGLHSLSFSANSYKNFTDSYFTEQSNLLEKEKNVYQYKDIECRFFYLMRSTQGDNSPDRSAVKQLEKIVHQPFMKEEDHAHSFESKVILYNTLAIFYFVKRDPEKAHQYALKLVEWHEAHPGICNDNMTSYIRALLNLLTIQIIRKKPGMFTVAINKLKAISNRHPQFRDWIGEKIVSAEITMHGITGNKPEGMKVVSEIEKKLVLQAGSISKYLQIDLCYHVAVFLLVVAKHKDALQWINKVLSAEENKPLEDLADNAKIVQLLIHYELGNIELLEYLVKSVYRFFYKKQQKFPFELYVLEFMKRLIHVHSHHELMQLFPDIKTKLTSLMKEDKLERKNMFFLELIISWVESKIGNRPLAEVVREKAIAAT